MVDYSGKHLGRLPTFHDPAVPMLMSLLHTDTLPEPPDEANWYQAVAVWPMDNNDTQPDCTSAAVAHAIQQWTTYGQNMSLIMQAAAVLGFYQLTKAPGDDGGAYLIDVMKYWMTKGVETGFGLHKIAAFAKIDPGNIPHTKCAVAWFGNLVIGLSLPISAQSQDVWVVVSGAAGKAGTWGGHCVLIVGYDKQFLYIVSWGRVMQMTWEFYEAYCDEAYAALTVSWMKPPGVAPSGFDWSGLKHAMAALKLAA